MSGFKPGDVVVCVDVVRPASPGLSVDPQLRQGALYSIRSTFVDRWGPCVKLREIEAVTCNRGYLASRFRHLPKADPAFTEAMRALRPEKEGVA